LAPPDAGQPRPYLAAMLSFSEYDQLDGLGMADLVRRGQLTGSELCEATIARAEAVNPQISSAYLRKRSSGRRAG
jgi:amidase